MFTSTQAFEVGICLHLGHLTGANSFLHLRPGVPGTHRPHCRIEFGRPCCRPEARCFRFGDPAGGDHLVQLCEDAIGFHDIPPPTCV